jgi:hypothetical protein
MFTCPNCPQTFPTIYLRDRHIQDFHRGGYPEAQQNVVGSSGKVELKALEHSIAAQREKMEKERPLASPIPMPISKAPPDQLEPSQGWKKISDNTYVFEQELYEHTTPFDSMVVTLEAKLNPKHGNCIEHKYTKNLTDLDKLKQKDTSLESRLTSYVPSDPNFSVIATELYNTKQQIVKFNRDIRADEVHTLILEDYYRFDPGDEQVKWMKSFMEKVNGEYERLKKNHHSENDVK